MGLAVGVGGSFVGPADVVGGSLVELAAGLGGSLVGLAVELGGLVVGLAVGLGGLLVGVPLGVGAPVGGVPVGVGVPPGGVPVGVGVPVVGVPVGVGVPPAELFVGVGVGLGVPLAWGRVDGGASVATTFAVRGWEEPTADCCPRSGTAVAMVTGVLPGCATRWAGWLARVAGAWLTVGRTDCVCTGTDPCMPAKITPVAAMAAPANVAEAA